MNQPPLIEARGIVKRFGAVLANDVARFDVRAGESWRCWAKTAPARARSPRFYTGYYTADAGEIYVAGQRVSIIVRRDARAHGIGMVFQTFTLIPALSVYENVVCFCAHLPAVPRRPESCGP